MTEQPRYSASVVGCGSGGTLSLNALAASSRYHLLAAADLREDVRQQIAARYPGSSAWLDALAASSLVPGGVIFVSLYVLFFTLTPTAYRARRYPKWPGALLVTAWRTRPAERT